MTSAALGLSYTEAIIAVASRDPALASCIIHLHECTESLKWKVGLLLLLAYGLVAGVFTSLGIVVWYAITHPHGVVV